jgi:hypothetical protein
LDDIIALTIGVAAFFAFFHYASSKKTITDSVFKRPNQIFYKKQ